MFLLLLHVFGSMFVLHTLEIRLLISTDLRGDFWGTTLSTEDHHKDKDLNNILV